MHVTSAAFVAEEYMRVPIAFEVRSVFDIGPGLELAERKVQPYIKDYDADESPATWSERFDLSRWEFFAAFLDGRRVGGAVLALDTPGIDMLEGRGDLAVLWDIRVAPDARGRGVGAALLRAALDRARRELKVETQSINVPACQFYAANGFELRAANRDAYPSHPDEVQLLWYKNRLR